MLGDFDHMSFGVIPEDVLVVVGYETQKDSFAGVRNQLGRSSTGRGHPNSATKSTQSRHVIFLAQSDVVG